MLMQSLRFLYIPLVTLLLSSCQTPLLEPAKGESGSANDPLEIRVLSNAEVFTGSNSADNRSMIPDILYAALQALSEDRLLTPVDDNAHARFNHVLAMDPRNELALEGLQDIVVRYLQLAEESMRRGIFDEAEILLSRARFVDSSHPGISGIEDALRLEMNSNDLFFKLDYSNYSSHSEQAENELVNIARQTREHEAFFLITAPNDDLARWMVSVMRKAVAGYRLRGNIELSSHLGIRLRMPNEE